MTMSQGLTKVKELSENIHQRLAELSHKPVRTRQNIEDDIDLEYRYSGEIYRYILENFQELHDAIAKASIENEKLKEKLRTHCNLALQADSLAQLLNDSDLFVWLSEPNQGSVNGSLDLLFSLITEILEEADTLAYRS